MNLKKVIAACVCLMMVATVLVSCTPAGSSTPAATQTASASAPSASPSAESAAASSAASSSTAASPSAEVAANDPFGKFDAPVKMSIGREIVTDSGTNFESGQDMNHNKYLDLIKSSLNIDVSYAWLAGSATDAEAYKTKVNLVIASGEMPDVMFVNDRQQLQQLMDAGMLANLTGAYNTYASDLTKKFYQSYAMPGDADGLATCRSNGQLQALPNTNIGYSQALVWVRKDWMDKLGETEPKTVDDLSKIAKDFVTKDPGGNGAGKTVGIVVNKDVAGTYNAVAALDNVFGAYQSYPKVWVKDPSGQYTYGTVMPQTKTALTKIAQMYKDGLIDPQFATDDFNQVVAAGQCGIVLGPWWQPWSPLAGSLKAGNASIIWTPYMAPLADDGNYYAPYPNPHTQWIVVNKNYAHPEAAVKLLNMTNFLLGQETDPNTVFPNTDVKQGDIYGKMNGVWKVWPFALQIAWNDTMLRTADMLKASFAANTGKATNPTYDNWVTAYYGYKKNPGKVTDDTVMYMNCISTLLLRDKNDLVKYPTLGFPGTTETMVTKWANLQTLEQQMILQIIMGQKPADYFDTFVQQWKDQGGTQITQEVNAQLNK